MSRLRVLLPLVLFASQPRASPAQEAPIEVLLIGDSITAGAVSGADGVAYAERLRSRLGADFEVRNIACPGTTSLDWTLTHASPWCSAEYVPPGLFETRALPILPVSFAAILLGTNDAVGFGEPEPVSVAAYAVAIDEIAANLLAAGAAQVILMTPPRNCGADASGQRRLFGYRRAILALCAGPPGLLCGPDLYALLDLDLHFASCDPHPNAAGHRVIASELARAVISAVPEPDAITSRLSALAALAVLALWTRLRSRDSAILPPCTNTRSTPATRGATSPAPNDSGASPTTSTSSETTDRWAATSGSGSAPISG